MPTPASGAISMNDMNVQITRASGTATVDMNTIRTRYGGSGAISFSDLRDSEGFTINPALYSDKFITSHGWADDQYGSVSPDEGNGRVQFAANSWLTNVIEFNTSGNTAIEIFPTSTTYTGNGTQVTAGYKTTDVTRVVMANTSRTISSPSSNNSSSWLYIDYDMPTSGTIHCLFKF